MTRFLVACVLLAGLAVPSGAAVEPPLDLDVRLARIEFRDTGTDTDRIVVRGRFVRPESLSHYDYQRDTVTLTVGDLSFTVPPAADGISIRAVGLSKGQRMKFRRPARSPGGLQAIAFNLRAGTFTARVGPADLSDAVQDGNWDVSIGLQIGDHRFATAVDLRSDTRPRRETWSYRSRNGTARPVGLLRRPSLTAEPEEPRNEVVRDREAWLALWTDLGGAEGSLPEVDFDRDMIVAVILGTRPSGGYSARIDRVTENDGGTLVRFTETKPGRNCIVLTVITHPFTLAKVRRTEGPATFEGRTRAERCR